MDRLALAGQTSDAAQMAAKALAAARSIRVNTPATFDQVSEFVRIVKMKHRELDELRKELVAPFNAETKWVNDRFRPALKDLESAEQQMKLALGAYSRDQEEARRATMAASAAMHAMGGVPTLAIPEPAQAPGVSIRQVPEFEVTNPDDVPRDLCSPDPAKIRARVLAADAAGAGLPSIPGVRVRYRDSVTVRQT